MNDRKRLRTYSVRGEVITAFDREPQEHVKIANIVLEKAKLSGMWSDVVI
jgi:transcription termination factor Rho